MIVVLSLAVLMSADPADPADLAGTVSKPPAGPTVKPATANSLQQLLVQAWDAPAHQVTKLGSRAVTRARTAKADVDLVQYAYGVLLVHHGQWETATHTFRKIRKSRPDMVLPIIALAHAYVNWDKPETALNLLEDAIKTNPTHDRVIDTVAAWTTFYKVHPPGRMKAGRLQKLEEMVLSQLNKNQLARFRDQVNQAKVFMNDVPKLRQRMQDDLTPIEQQYERQRVQYQAKFSTYKQIFQQAKIEQQTAQKAQAQYLQTANQYERLIGLALRVGDEKRAMELGVEKSKAVQPLIEERDEALRIYQQRRESVALAEVELKQLAEQARLVEADIKRRKQAIAQLSAQPPLTFQAKSARAELLAMMQGKTLPTSPPAVGQPVVGTEPEPPMVGNPIAKIPALPEPSPPTTRPVPTPPLGPEPNVPRDTQKQARELLALAKLKLTLGHKQEGKAILEQLISRFPASRSAQSAQKMLDVSPSATP